MRNLSSDTKTYASLALFRKMKDDNTDILDVVETLAANAALLQGGKNFSKEDLAGWTLKEYDFDIPDGAFDLILQRKGKFEITSQKPLLIRLKPDTAHGNDSVYRDQLEEFNNLYSGIENQLCEYIRKNTGSTLDDEQRAKVLTALYNHILDKGHHNEYTPWIYKFILQNESDSEFNESLDRLLEGLLLYLGLNTEAKDKNIDSFDTPLILVLDTEILFHISGYHGEIFKRRVFQFIEYVEEVNKTRYANKKRVSDPSGRIIRLKYLPSTKEEIDRIFTSVEYAKRMQRPPQNYTMVESFLHKNFTSAHEITEELDKFWRMINDLGIKEVEDMSKTDLAKYELIKEDDFDSKSDQGHMVSHEEAKANLIESSDVENVDVGRIDTLYYHLIRLNHIYALRGGNTNDYRLERAKCVMISDTHAVIKKSKDLRKDGTVKNSYHLAVPLSEISVTFWLKLNKGLSPDERPISYDILAKTRCALANIAGETLLSEYQKIKTNVKEGKLSEREALQKIHALRSLKMNADDFQDADDVTPFIQDNAIDYWIKLTEENHQAREAEWEKREAIWRETSEENKKLREANEQYKLNETRRKRDDLYKLYEDNLTNWDNHMRLDVRNSLRTDLWIAFVWMVVLVILLVSSLLSLTLKSTNSPTYILAIIAVSSFITIILSLSKQKGFINSIKFIFSSDYRSRRENELIEKYEIENPKPTWIEPEEDTDS